MVKMGRNSLARCSSLDRQVWDCRRLENEVCGRIWLVVKKGTEHFNEFGCLEPCGLCERAENGNIIQARCAAGSHANISKDPQGEKGAFGRVFSGRAVAVLSHEGGAVGVRGGAGISC